MPLLRCQVNNSKGWKFGATGRCFVGPEGRSKAVSQGRAIQASQTKNDADNQGVMMIQFRQGQAGKKPRKKAPKKLPKWLYPFPVERQYERVLVGYIDVLNNIVENQLIPHIPSLVFERNQNVPEGSRTDDYADDAERLMNAVTFSFGAVPLNKKTTAERVGDGTNAWNDKEWQKQLRAAFGVNSFQREPFIGSTLNSFTKENVQLITKMEQDYIDNISTTLQRGLRQGDRAETIAKRIEKTTNTSKSRARLIARDQVGKLNGNLTELRQTNLGVDGYIWRSADDSRVRPSHARHDNTQFKWDSPPSGTGHPGQDFQCRCYAEPVFISVFDELSGTKTKEAETAISPERTAALAKKKKERETRDKIIKNNGVLVEKGPDNQEQAVKFFNTRAEAKEFQKSKNLKGSFIVRGSLSGKSELRVHTANNPNAVRELGGKVTKAKKTSVKKAIKRTTKTTIATTTAKNIPGLVDPENEFSKKPIPVGNKTKADIIKSAEKVGEVPLEYERSLRKYEEGIRFNKFESGARLDLSTGNIIDKASGKAAAVRIPNIGRNTVYTHNHPTTASFSGADLSIAVDGNILQARATSPTKLFTMTRANDEWITRSDMKKHYKGFNNIFQEEYDKDLRSSFSKHMTLESNKTTLDTWSLSSHQAKADRALEKSTIEVSKKYAKRHGWSFKIEEL